MASSIVGDAALPCFKNTSKNYLNCDKIYMLRILCEQGLIFAESRPSRVMKMRIDRLMQKFDGFLRFKGHEIFLSYKQYLKGHATLHAKWEFAAWRKHISYSHTDAT